MTPQEIINFIQKTLDDNINSYIDCQKIFNLPSSSLTPSVITSRFSNAVLSFKGRHPNIIIPLNVHLHFANKLLTSTNYEDNISSFVTAFSGVVTDSSELKNIIKNLPSHLLNKKP